MPRRLRLEYPDAIYHLMARGNGRQEIVNDDDDRDRLRAYLGRTALRSGWRVYAFVVMSNHLHVVLKTPQPNLARGMQVFLSSYANVWARRHRFSGHVFQGRYRAELIEDETYLWSVTRYVHLNPVRAGMVDHPAQWLWSSYPGYAHVRHRVDWVAHEELLAAWDGAFGGRNSARAYRRYVTHGLTEPSPSPWSVAHHGWIMGSEAFADRIAELVRGDPPREHRRESRRIQGLDLARVCQVVCTGFGTKPSDLSCRGSRHPARQVLAFLARRYTVATNAEVAVVLGLSRPESVPNLTRRIPALLAGNAELRRRTARLEQELSGCVPSRKT